MRMSDLHIESEQQVITPRAVHEKYPLTSKAQTTVQKGREEFLNILNGTSDKLALMVGPCSIHNYQSAIEYAWRLAALADNVRDHIQIIMRVYFEKPRTTVGWKGLITDPHLNGSDDLNDGLQLARKIMGEISEIGLPIVTEFLDPRVPRYISDLVTTGTIGARTTESQTHREMASGLSPSIGFKNSTDGTVRNAIDAALSARSSHKFLGINLDGVQMLYKTTGNPNGYLILRGGNGKTNFRSPSVRRVIAEMEKRGVSFPIVVDCSHGNSRKNHELQRIAFDSVLRQKLAGENHIIGMMLESNLLSGAQKFDAGKTPVTSLTYGVSITDACIGWDETEALILDAYRKLQKRKQLAA